MDPFSYLSVLISIVLALGMTRVLAGVGDMLQARSRRHIYWVHAVWIVSAFVPLRVVAKKFLQLIVRRSIRETIKASVFGELLGRAHKPTPRHTRERTAYTDSPHTECSDIRHR